MEPELVLFYFNCIASGFGLVALCLALGQFAHVEYKLYMCKKQLYKENKFCISTQLKVNPQTERSKTWLPNNPGQSL